MIMTVPQPLMEHVNNNTNGHAGGLVFVLPVVYLDILVSLRVIHEPHQLQMKDWREGKELHSFFCFL